MFSYIILHYKTISETLTCLENLKKIINRDSHIIIVDNNSLNNDDELKLKIYTDDIIKLDNNVGFAQANNIGIKYAKEKYKSNYYVVLNNDVFISQKNFEKLIAELYKKEQFDMVGPKIDSPSGESVNPFPVLRDRKAIIKEINKCKKLIKIYNNSLLNYLLNKYIYIKKNIKKRINVTNGIKKQYNAPLHGCCIIFSNQYIEKYKYPFFNNTFLFHEEEFLYQRVLNDKLVSIYYPDIKVFHKEGSSVNKSNKNIRLSKLFREKEKLKSLELLIQYINEFKN